MCSISGIWRFNGPTITEKEITDFNNVTHYRGPDGDGVFVDTDANLALGHRRLSIIDLSEGGKQPMFSADDNLAITFNGEIYNYLELKEELTAKGHRFVSHSDTEVILAAYQQWGEDCLLKFNGMWAFAIWNRRERCLFLSRDRFGVKPLYYIHRPGKLFAFASESVAFKKLPGFQKTFNHGNVTIALKDNYYLEAHGETIYKDVFKLLPGHWMKVTADGAVQIKRWWKTEEHLVTVPKTYEEQVEAFRELFSDACRLRLRSDVPVGIALSGGLDSSAVYGTIQKLANPEAHTDWKNAFIASFPGTQMDEKAYADEVVKYTAGVANYIYPHNGNVADSIYRETKSEDFIYSSPSVVHNIYKGMRERGIVVSLDGHGADEMLFGYSHMVYALLCLNLNNRDAETVDTWKEMNGITAEEAHRMMDAEMQKARQQENRNLHRLYDRFVPEHLKLMYRKQRFKAKRNTSHLLNYYQAPHHRSTRPFLNSNPALDICYGEFHFQLPTLLRNWDRASMKHGVEIRMPFMDWRLATYVFSLPASAKLSGGYTKRIVRDAVKGYIPENIRLRKNKIGVNAPMAEWFNHDLSSFVLDIVNSQSFLTSEIWNGPVLRQKLEELTKTKTWRQKDGVDYWPYLNAWILMN